jgi:hypothetical protein
MLPSWTQSFTIVMVKSDVYPLQFLLNKLTGDPVMFKKAHLITHGFVRDIICLCIVRDFNFIRPHALDILKPLRMF